MVRKSSTDKTDEELVELIVAGDTVMILGSKQENAFEAYGVRAGEENYMNRRHRMKRRLQRPQ